MGKLQVYGKGRMVTNGREMSRNGTSATVSYSALWQKLIFLSFFFQFVDHFRNQKVRPHWGKRHDNIPGIIDHIKLIYGDNLDHFQKMRKLAEVDPCDMFMNSYLLEIFGRSGTWCA